MTNQLPPENAPIHQPEPEAKPKPRGQREKLLVRDETRQQRHTARWVLRGLLALAVAVAALGNGGVSWTVMAVVWALLLAALPAAYLAVPSKPPRVRLGFLWWLLGLVTALQVVPLPRFLVGALQPMSLQLADLGRAALNLPPATFAPLALAPGDAAFQGAVYLLGGCLALLGSIALSGHDGRRCIHWTVNVVLVVASISGAAWVCAFMSPITDFVPPGLSLKLANLCFVNPNQEAGLLNMGIAVALGRMSLAINSRWQTVFGLAALLLCGVILEVGSRGGILTMALVLALTVFMRPGPVKGRRADLRDLQRAAAVRLGVLIASVALTAAIVALPALDREFGAVADSHKVEGFARLIGLQPGSPGPSDLLHATWLAGAGPAGLPVLTGLDAKWGRSRIDFAENFLLDHVFNLGIFLGLAFLLAVLWIVIRWLKRRNDVPQAPGPTIAAYAMLVENMVDFSLELGGGLLPFMATATALERALPPPEGREDMEAKRLPHHRRVLLASGLGLIVAGILLGTSLNAMTRSDEAVLHNLPLAEMKTLVASRFLYDHHAFYLYGRKLFAQGQMQPAERAFHRAVQLRPSSPHAHLFRFATRLKLQKTHEAAEDLRWLLDQDDDMLHRALNLCLESPAAQEVLLDVLPRGPDQSERVAQYLATSRPDLVESVALKLRTAFPDKMFGIEYVRGTLYLKRGNLEPARRIAANLLSRPQTKDFGYVLEAMLLVQGGKHYQAFHLFRDVCDRMPDSWTACSGAIEAIINSNRPAEALRYLNARAPFLQDHPTHAGYMWYNKGRVAQQLGRLEDALEAFRRAHGFIPQDVSVTLSLADTSLQIGLREEARSLVDEALALQPNSPTAQRLSKELDREAQHAFEGAHAREATPSIL